MPTSFFANITDHVKCTISAAPGMRDSAISLGTHWTVGGSLIVPTRNKSCNMAKIHIDKSIYIGKNVILLDPKSWIKAIYHTLSAEKLSSVMQTLNWFILMWWSNTPLIIIAAGNFCKIPGDRSISLFNQSTHNASFGHSAIFVFAVTFEILSVLQIFAYKQYMRVNYWLQTFFFIDCLCV